MVLILFEPSKTSQKAEAWKSGGGGEGVREQTSKRGGELRGGRSKLDTLALREKKERKKPREERIQGNLTPGSPLSLYFLFCPKLFRWSSYRTALCSLFSKGPTDL